MDIKIENLEVIIITILVLFVGQMLTRKISFLYRYNIPVAVIGGILSSTVIVEANDNSPSFFR